jgi:hypothetical protein
MSDRPNASVWRKQGLSKQPMNLHAASRVSMLNDSTWNQWWSCFFPEQTELPKKRITDKSDTKVTPHVLPERGESLTRQSYF